jgi:hypothetical protein
LTKTLQKPKNSMSSIDIFKQIINERHIVMKLNRSDPYKRLAKKVITPALRTGIVTRAFSRNKLELFTRPDPSDLKHNLKARVNSIVNHVEVATKPSKTKPVARYLSFKPQMTEGHSVEAVPTTDRQRVHTLADQSMATVSQSRKELGLKDFPFERLAIQHLEQVASKRPKQSKDRDKRYASLNICLNKSTSNASGDFFPARYKLSALQDRAIVNAFNQSFTSSGRNSLSRHRVSEFPSPQA